MLAMTPAMSHDRQPEQRIATRRRPMGLSFHVGDRVEAEDSQKKWYPARIVKVDEEDSCVLIHFEGFNTRYDEWIEIGSSKLRPLTRREKLPHLKVGEAVLAKWTDGKFYEARVADISEESYRVEFYDGFSRTLSPNNIRPVKQLSRSQSRASSGRSSVESAGTPSFVVSSATRLSGVPRRRGRPPSCHSESVSSCGSTPLHSRPDSPAEEVECNSNGHSHASPELNNKLHATKRRHSPPTSDAEEDLVGDLPVPASALPPSSSCGMSSLHPGSNGNCRSDNLTTHIGQTVPVSRGSPVLSKADSPSTVVVSSVNGRTATAPPRAVLQSPTSGNGLPNGFRAPLANGHGSNGCSLPSRMAPCVDDRAESEFAMMDERDLVSPIIAPPTLPDFTPLSPRSSPQRSATPAPAAAAAASTPHLVSSVSSVQTCTTPVCSVAECPSPASDSSVPPVAALVSPTSTPASTRQCIAPFPAMTLSGSPLVDTTPVVSALSWPVPRTEAMPSSDRNPVSCSSSSLRHEVAPAPTTHTVAAVEQPRVAADVAAVNRPKRKKVDGVLAPPPARIAPKEVIPVQDHNPFKCKVCNKSVRKWHLLESHYKNYHPDNRREYRQAKKEYERQPSFPVASSSSAGPEPVMKLEKKRQVSVGKSFSGTPQTPGSGRLRSAAGSAASVKAKEEEMEGMRPITPFSVSHAAAFTPVASDTPVLPPANGVPGSSAAAGTTSACKSTLSAKSKRKGATGGPPAKRGRPPLSSYPSNAISTPKLAGLRVQPITDPACSELTPASMNNVHSKLPSNQRDVSFRIPKSRRSLSFSQDLRQAENFDDATPTVRTDNGISQLPTDVLLCCPCRQELPHGVLVKCVGCLTYQHLACISPLPSPVMWSRYRCRACTHPAGKRYGARDRLPYDWYNSRSVCRNPCPLITRNHMHSDVQPLIKTEPLASGNVDGKLRVSADVAEFEFCRRLVDLQQATGQDIHDVGEVLSATCKQLLVIRSPDKPSHRAAINRVLPPRVKVEASSVVSPICIATEAINNVSRPPSIPNVGRESAGDVKSRMSSPVCFSAGDGKERLLDQVSVSAILPLPSSFSFAPDTADSKLGSALPSRASPVSHMAQCLMSTAGFQSLQELPQTSRTSPLSSERTSPISAQSRILSLESSIGPAVLPSRMSPQELSAAVQALSPPLPKKPASLPAVESTTLSKVQKQAGMSTSISPPQPASSVQSSSSKIHAGLTEASKSTSGSSKASSNGHPKSESDFVVTPLEDNVFSPIMKSLPTTPSSSATSPALSRNSLSSQSRPTSLVSEGRAKRAVPESEEERRVRVQAASQELLGRVRSLHGSVDRRLAHLEDVVSALERMERDFCSSQPRAEGLSGHQQRLCCQRVIRSLDDLQCKDVHL